MKFNIDLGSILTKAWQITWKFKVLWIFGILAGFGAGGNNGYNGGGGNGGGGGSSSGGDGNLPEWMRQFENMRPEQAFRSFLDQYMGIIAGVILLLCVLWLVFYFLGVMGRVGLIKGIGKADAGAEKLTFGELWSESTSYFWRMFGLSVLVGLPFFLVTILVLGGLLLAGFSVFQGNPSEGGLVATILGLGGVFVVLMCVIGIVGTLVGLIVEQAQNAIVLEDLGVLPGLARGWEVFSKNWLSVVVVGLVLWVIGIVVGLVIALPFLVVLIPAAAGIGMAAAMENWVLMAVVIGGCILLWLPVALVLSGIQQTYFQSVWTLAFRRLAAAPADTVTPAPLENVEPM